MLTNIAKIIGTATLLIASANAAQAKAYQDVTLGGVNLTSWCQKAHGSAFKAKLIKHNAGGWTCEQSAGNRRPILVSKACKLQYGKRAYKARAFNQNDPYSWKCIGRKAVVTMRGVNLSPWCKKQYGNAFKAKLIKHNAGGWTCEQSAGNRRPILVSRACKLQYGGRAYKAKALNWNDPYSWKCLLR